MSTFKITAPPAASHLNGQCTQRTHAVATATALWLATGLTCAQPAMAQPAPTETLGSISIVHGQVFDSRARPLKVDAALLHKLQQATIEQLEGKASTPPPSRNLHQALVGSIPSKTNSAGDPHADVLLANALHIDQMGRQQPSQASAQISRANAYLITHVMGRETLGFDPGSRLTSKASWPQVAAALQQLKGPKPFPWPWPKPRYTYSSRCAAAGVPVPPSFNSNGSTGWHREGALSFSILNPGQYSELYTYTPASGNGMCMALPIRKTAAQGNYDALGIICQGLSTTADPNASNSQACFWDNATDTMVPNTTYPINGPTFIAPPNLPSNNQCTDCHAGENAFITHKGSVIETAKDTFNTNHATNFTSRNNWYTPRVDATWPQNPEPAGSYNGGNGLATAACVSCHTPNYAGRIPDVTGAAGANPGRDKLFLYCWAISSGQITSGIGPHAASVHLNGTPGPMKTHTGAGNVDLDPLYQACNKVIPVFMGFPASATDWVNW